MRQPQTHDPFSYTKYRKSVRYWLLTLEDICGLPLTERYDQWLALCEMTGEGKRRSSGGVLPAGISSAKDFIIKQSDIDEILRDVDLYAPRPDYRTYISRKDLTLYDCGVAYYLSNRPEVNSKIRRIKFQLDRDPSDRYTPEPNPGASHVDYDSSKSTDQMLTIAFLDKTYNKLVQKKFDYDRVVVAVAIKTLGIAAQPIIDARICGQYIANYKAEDEQKVREALEQLEYQQCEARGEVWSNQKPEYRPWEN